MENSTKALTLIIFMIEDKQPKTLLKDTLYYNPRYRAGDVIHLVTPPGRAGQSDADRQYVILSAKNVIMVDAAPDHTDYMLLVEVAGLAADEQESTGFLVPILLN